MNGHVKMRVTTRVAERSSKPRDFLRSAQSSPGHSILQTSIDRALAEFARIQGGSEFLRIQIQNRDEMHCRSSEQYSH